MTAVVPSFDQLRARPVGDGAVVARFPGVVAVCSIADVEVLETFLSVCAEVSQEGARAPGRRLARRLAGWLVQRDDEPDLGTVSATDGGLAIFLSGQAAVELGRHGPRHSARDAAGWLDLIVEWPDRLALSVTSDARPDYQDSVYDLRGGIVAASYVVLAERVAGAGDAEGLAVNDAPEPAAADADGPVAADLGPAAPVEPAPSESDPPPTEAIPTEPSPTEFAAADAVAGPDPALTLAAPVEREPEPEPEPEPAPSPLPPPADLPEPLSGAAGGPVAGGPSGPPSDPHVPAGFGSPIPSEPVLPVAPPALSAKIFGSAASEPSRTPLPVPGRPSAGPPGPAEVDDVPQVQGFLCSRGHLNDPRGLFCGVCGIRMSDRTGVLTIGRRPPLGLFVFDDGSTFTVDADYLLGREPEIDPGVRGGALRPLTLQDVRGAVSRRHARITLDGWNVLITDVGSANGTFLAGRTGENWQALVPHRPFRLEAGTRVRVGSRLFIFETQHGAP